jgi:hypothetical protein
MRHHALASRGIHSQPGLSPTRLLAIIENGQFFSHASGSTLDRAVHSLISTSFRFVRMNSG